MSRSSVKLLGHAGLVLPSMVTMLPILHRLGTRLQAAYMNPPGLSLTMATGPLLAQGTPMHDIPLIRDDPTPVGRLVAGLFPGQHGH